MQRVWDIYECDRSVVKTCTGDGGVVHVSVSVGGFLEPVDLSTRRSAVHVGHRVAAVSKQPRERVGAVDGDVHGHYCANHRVVFPHPADLHSRDYDDGP